MSTARNLIVAQSGGPSPVINSSLRGILESARGHRQIGTVYGARHGIEGVLREELLDLSGPAGRGGGPAAVYPRGRVDRHLPL